MKQDMIMRPRSPADFIVIFCHAIIAEPICGQKRAGNISK